LLTAFGGRISSRARSENRITAKRLPAISFSFSEAFLGLVLKPVQFFH